MKLCKDCKHFNAPMWCHSPQNGISPIDGFPKSRLATENRKSGGYNCGITAKFFEIKEIEETKPWWKFW